MQLTLLVTPAETLPPELQAAPQTIRDVATEIAAQSDGKLIFSEINPDDPASSITRATLLETYGLQPYLTSLFSDQSYYMHMILQNGEQQQLIYPSNDLSEGGVRTVIETALKRSSAGFLKTVGLWTPPSTPTQDMFGQQQQPLSSWANIQQQLAQEYTVQPIDLSTGQAPTNIDTLFVVMPQNLTDKDRFAIDQFLMRGGAVIVAAGNYTINVDPMTQGLALQPLDGTLQEMLKHYGIEVQPALVMDDQNQPFLVPDPNTVGSGQPQYVVADFPFFVDVRQEGMTSGEAMVSGLPAVTLNFVSPVVTNLPADSGRTATVLLQSSAASWTTADPNIQPDYALYPERGFAVVGEQKAYPLAVTVQGSFTSFFEGKPSPLTAAPPAADGSTPPATPVPDTGMINQSPDSARLVVIGSGSFLDDFITRISQQIVGEQVLNNLQFAQNAVDWSVEDTDLLMIRARGTNTRLLEPLEESERTSWELGNYAVALLALALTAGLWYLRRRNEQPMELSPSTLTPAAAD